MSARARLTYVNNSPDTLREMYVHQYLNAFRPRSKWSQVDAREGRVRFQNLREPDYGYERFTAPVRVGGTPVSVSYPGAPDSTVARFALPLPLLPGDSIAVDFEWDARPSTVPRRQARRGRRWDLAQWYPKVAVYDRGGWQFNALQPAGEFYGEYGTFDVLLYVAADQVIGATGVPVTGDPGWSRVARSGVRPATPTALVEGVPPRAVSAPAGMKGVRFYARDVHHFAWSASPDYRYEGGVYVRRAPVMRFRTWDTVAVHVLYRPGDDTTWGGGRAVERTINAMRWLELVFGPYAYPQMTVLHRIDGGGTEFPMMQMNGSASQGLILHEGGHVWAYGILGDNEWRSGWMDEGLTSYQTDWAQQLTAQEHARADAVGPPAQARGYRAHAITPTIPRFDNIALNQALGDLLGESQPIGTIAHEFRDFNTYNDMIYNRGQVMFSQLRDVLGDSVFAAFLRDYYARWALRHVDERAMRAAAERVSGKDLGWFFEQWIRHTGVTDYAIERVERDSESGEYSTKVTIARRGEYRHPMWLGVRTRTGWNTVQTSATSDRQTVAISTRDEPLEIRLDPFHFSWDWDRRNDVAGRSARWNFDWPLLTQADRDRSVVLARPVAWYSEPGGAVAGMRIRTSYLAQVDKHELGIVSATRPGVPAEDRVQGWLRFENPSLPFLSRPAMGWYGSAAWLDDVVRLDIGRKRQYVRANRLRVTDYALTVADQRAGPLLPESWSVNRTVDLSSSMRSQVDRLWGRTFTTSNAVGGIPQHGDPFVKAEAAWGVIWAASPTRRLSGRAYGGLTTQAPPAQRAIYLNVADPLATFGNDWWRPAQGAFKQIAVNALPLGGAALRGFRWDTPVERIGAANVELSQRLGRTSATSSRDLSVWLNLFSDAALLDPAGSILHSTLVDAGVGLAIRGRLYDRPINIRIDSPLFVNHPELAIDRGRAGREKVAPRWMISFNDIW